MPDSERSHPTPTREAPDDPKIGPLTALVIILAAIVLSVSVFVAAFVPDPPPAARDIRDVRGFSIKDASGTVVETVDFPALTRVLYRQPCWFGETRACIQVQGADGQASRYYILSDGHRHAWRR